jgi:hypothetical protein
MSAAVDICILDARIQEELLTSYRDMMHKAIDTFVDALADDLVSDKPMTLMEITRAISNAKPALLTAAIEEFIKSKHVDILSQEQAECPCCNRKIKRSAMAPRTIETLLGKSTITRPYFYCASCKHGFTPGDALLDLSTRKKQADLQKLALEFLADLPFERASELFFKATGISFSDHQMHDLFAEFTEEATASEVIPSAVEIERRIAEVTAKSPKRRPVLVAATDGAHTPIRSPSDGRDQKRGPGEYKEAKGFRLYLLDEDRIVHIASWHQVGSAEELGYALKLAASRIPHQKVRTCLVGDGAPWLWNIMQQAFPGAREVLDYYHCSEHIHALAEVQYGDDPQKAFLWVESTMARLSHKNEVGAVIGGIKRMQPANEAARECIRKIVNYLSNNKDRFNYHGARRGGYAIGSGGIESANKFICHVRIKRSGAWWLVSNCNNMLKLRCALVNGTFEKLFNDHATREKAKRLSRKA